MRKIAFAAAFLWAGLAGARTDHKDLLIKFADTAAVTEFALMAQNGGAKVETLGTGNWLRVRLSDKQLQRINIKEIQADPNVVAVQPNYRVRLLHDFKASDSAVRARIEAFLQENPSAAPKARPDNPAIPARGSGGFGPDPKYGKQWGMGDIGVKNGWSRVRGGAMIVAVIDTGVDYTHEDLVDNLWRNPGESGPDALGRDKASNGVDDDGNGYVDDTIGWDFVSNDNKPYDLAMDPLELVLKGGNPGHGTHCAGNVGARAENGKGVVGVAPDVKIMSLRFLSEKGQGTTADAIMAINYAVANGARILSNSWGSEGEDPKEDQENRALREAISAAEQTGVLFIAAAGNGHQGAGYDNDTDPKPAFPASYVHDNIISVAALDKSDRLGRFSNWGARTVDLGAPGVVVYSTTVGSKYSDTVIDLFGLKATWDGTSMATPHVAGAAALYWSAHPNATWREVKQAILDSTTKIPALNGKTVSGGKLNVAALMGNPVQGSETEPAPEADSERETEPEPEASAS